MSRRMDRFVVVAGRGQPAVKMFFLRIQARLRISIRWFYRASPLTGWNEQPRLERECGAVRPVAPHGELTVKGRCVEVDLLTDDQQLQQLAVNKAKQMVPRQYDGTYRRRPICLFRQRRADCSSAAPPSVNWIQSTVETAAQGRHDP